MSVILEFPKSATKSDAAAARVSPRGTAAEAEIVIFPGVRIERADARVPTSGAAGSRPGAKTAYARRSADDAD